MTTPKTDECIDILAEALYNEQGNLTSYRKAVEIADTWRDEKEQYFFRQYVQDIDNTRKKAAKILKKLDQSM